MSYWQTIAVTYVSKPAQMAASGSITAKYQAGGADTAHTESLVTPQSVGFDITTRYGEQIVPGSVNFTLGGKNYFDRDGRIYTDLEVATGAATTAGTINYSTGAVIVTAYNVGAANGVTINSMLTTTGDNTVSGVAFRIPVSPVRPGSVQILATQVDGTALNVTAGTDGTISGTGMRGTVNYDTGVVGVEFGAMVTAAGNENQPWYDANNVVGSQVWMPAMALAETLKYNAVAYSYLPLDADRLGLDPVRLPQDGKVPIFRKGSFVVVGNTETSTAHTFTAGQTYNTGRVRLSRVRVLDFNGVAINTGWSVDLEGGVVTISDVTGWAQPVKIEDRIEDLLLVNDVEISGQLTFTRQVTHAYPAGSYVSGALVAGDLHARVSTLFDQATWDSATWSDDLVGNGAPAEYNDTQYPPVVANFGAITERWILRFTSTTQFQVIGEHVGIIATGTINADCAPTNPATNTPYFTLKALGWGTGWAIGNCIRMNTVGAQFPVWVVRTVQQGAETVLDDKFSLLIRGDVDRPATS